jgi:formamidopyrimidine-DNA glycosylase
MIEIPEAVALARQIDEALHGETVCETVAGHTPHKFAWYSGDVDEYPAMLTGRAIEGAYALAGRVEIVIGDHLLDVCEGAALRFYPPSTPLPAKHQMLLKLGSGAALVGTVAMYGAFLCFRPGEMDHDSLYAASSQAPSPLGEGFDRAHFDGLMGEQGQRLSAKAFLATEQRIPGLGNGVLQDILFNARINPRRKMGTLSEDEKAALFGSVKATLREMAEAGGRDTERDLYGNPGGYATKMSRLTLGLGCPACGGQVVKQAYLGGSVYCCPECQRL